MVAVKPAPLLVLESLSQYPPVQRLSRNKRRLLVLQCADLRTKREMLHVAVKDLEVLCKERIFGHWVPSADDPLRGRLDQEKPLRLQFMLEGILHTTYSACEIAAQILHSLDHQFSPSFHAIAKVLKAPQAEHHMALATAMGDLSWFFKMREIRTEWTHHSASFVVSVNGVPGAVVTNARRPSDQEAMKGVGAITSAELPQLFDEMDQTMERIGTFALSRYVIPRLDPNEEVTVRAVDKDGRTIWDEARGHDVLIQKTMGEVLSLHGIASGC